MNDPQSIIRKEANLKVNAAVHTEQLPHLSGRWAPPFLGYEKLVVWLTSIGIVLRFRQYLFDRSLWLDEAMLTLNLIHRSAAGLLKPLDYHQGAPLGFLLLEKAVIRAANSGEMALRFIPFVSGIVSLFLFVAVAKRFLLPGAVAIAVGSFAICGPLIYYSAEAKQYSSDVAITLILLLAGFSLLQGHSGRGKTVLLSMAAAIALWFSQPAAFVVAAIGGARFWVSAHERDRSAWINLAVFGGVTSCSFALYYLVSLRSLVRDQTLLDYWQGAFAPLPTSPSQAQWYLDSFFGLFSDPTGLTFTGIAMAGAIIGIRQVWADRQWKAILLLLPIFLALIASSLHRYPFRGRLLLFIVPSIILLTAAGLDTIRIKTRHAIRPLGALLIGLIFIYPGIAAARAFVRPKGVEESRPVIDYLEKHRLDGDILYCYYSAEPALQYYSYEGLMRPIPTVEGVDSRTDWALYRRDIEKLRGKRVWILFSHVYSSGGADEERLFLDDLDHLGRKMDSKQALGASVYLYDLGDR